MKKIKLNDIILDMNYVITHNGNVIGIFTNDSDANAFLDAIENLHTDCKFEMKEVDK